MKQLVFRKWDWEHDKGIGPITGQLPPPASHVAVLYDDRGLPYRVRVQNPDDLKSLDRVHDDRTYVYDYTYDDDGRVLEKRALDANYDVALIVRYQYVSGKKTAEVGWSPQKGGAPIRVRTL